MSQERSRAGAVALSLSLAVLAYGASLLAMAYTQAALIRTVPLRWVLVFSELALAAPALIVGLILARRMPEIYRFRTVTGWGALTTCALGLALWGLSLGVFEAQYVFVKPPLAYLEQFQGLHEMLKPVGISGWLLSIAAIALAPAICEEILFRGLLVPVFKAALGPMVAIGLSAAMFGAIHVDAMPGGVSVYYRVPFAFILGILLAKIRLDTGSLLPPIIAHATLNATTFIVVQFVEEPKGVLPDPQPLVAIGMLLVGSAIARTLMRKIARPPEAA